MSAQPQWARLVEYLGGYPDGRTIKQCRDDLWVQNIQDAAMQARRHGKLVETIYVHSNRKIASYRLARQERPATRYSIPKINLLPQMELF